MTNQKSEHPKKKDQGGNTADLAMMMGKLPPQNLEGEEAVLGALMLEQNAINVVLPTIISPDYFYKEANRIIYEAILKLYSEKSPIDLLTVTNELRKKNQLDLVGGPYYIVELTQRISSAANLEFHAAIVSENYMKREVIKICSQGTKNGFDYGFDIHELLDWLMTSILAIQQPTLRKQSSALSTLIREALKRYDELSNRPVGVMTGVPSGLDALDALTNGFQKSDFIVIAARPGMGKTAMVVCCAINATKKGKRIFLCSLEMSKHQIVDRIVSSETGVFLKKLRSRPSEMDLLQVHKNINHLLDSDLYIDDTPALSITDLRAKVLAHISEHGEIDEIIVDYLQLMRGSEHDKRTGNNREQEVGSISRGLKALAKELNIPVIALSQLSRGVETRGGDKRPGLSDLRESGSIEQDADMVLFLYRPEYYQITQDEQGNDTRGRAEIIIAKHRNGSLDTAHVRFDGDLTRFANLNDEWAQPEARDFAPDPVAQTKYREPKEDVKQDVFRQAQPSSLLDMMPAPPPAGNRQF